jgi:hypothetical protein
MSALAIVDITKINTELLSIGEPKKGKGTTAQLMYDGQKSRIRLPKMSFPGGLLTRIDEQSGAANHSLIGTLKGCPTDGKARCEGDDPMAKMYNVLQDVGTLIKKWAHENGTKLFGKKRSEESINDSFNDRSIMSISCDKVGNEYVPNGKYPPSFKAKVPVWDGKITMEVVDQANKNVKLDLETLSSVFPKGVSANLLVTGSVYIIGQSFGISWRIEMAQVFPPNRITAASVFEEVQEVPEAEPVAASSTLSEAQEVEAETESGSPTLVAPARKRRAAVNPA